MFNRRELLKFSAGAILAGAATAGRAGPKPAEFQIACMTLATEPASEPGGEQSGEGGTSDGPGGHEDPAGNVDHQFNGKE